MESVRVALSQFTPTHNVQANLAAIREHAEIASSSNAQWLLLPEYATGLDRRRANMTEVAAQAASAMEALRELASSHRIQLFVGSMVVPTDDGRMANRSVVVSPSGNVVAQYDKIHMFDVALASGLRITESAAYLAGARAVYANVDGFRVGLTICYDLRFPHLYRALAGEGCDVLLVPAAFTRETGRKHWLPLLQARAIENRAYVLAAATCGDSPNGRSTHGHSMVLDPDGDVIASLGQAPGVVVTEICKQTVVRAREHIPSLQHDQPFTVQSAH